MISLKTCHAGTRRSLADAGFSSTVGFLKARDEVFGRSRSRVEPEPTNNTIKTININSSNPVNSINATNTQQTLPPLPTPSALISEHHLLRHGGKQHPSPPDAETLQRLEYTKGTLPRLRRQEKAVWVGLYVEKNSEKQRAASPFRSVEWSIWPPVYHSLRDGCGKYTDV
ncbi:hypothetical protein MHYP_G00188870 [Metynnis hypsauchen]